MITIEAARGWSDFRSLEGNWYDYSLKEPHDNPDNVYRWTGTKR